MVKYLLLFFLSANTWAYYGIHSTEANLKFAGRIEVEFFGGLSLSELNSQNSEENEIVSYQVNEQLQHLLGTFSSESFIEETNGATAAISKDYKITFTNIEPSETEDHFIISYEYDGTVLVHRDFFGPEGRKRKGLLPIKLPLNYKTIYELTRRYIMVPVDEYKPWGAKEETWFSLCTDDHYNSAGDFFYFWDPDRINSDGRRGWDYADCPLMGDDKNVVRVEGELTRLNNSYQKYLEYDRLYGEKGKTLKIWVFLGYIDDVHDFKKVNLKDSVWDTYDRLNEAFSELGLELVEEYDEKKFSASNGFYGKGINSFVKYQKLKLKRDPVREGENEADREMNIELNMLVSDTAYGSQDGTFHHFYRKATKEADIILYDGHSGLGANTDLEGLGAELAPADKYQVIFLNGCSGYPYFKNMYFNAKEGGSQNLDLFLSGIATLQESSVGNAMAFLEGFLQGKTLNTSWILQRIEEVNYESLGSYLTGVLGEEDNKWKKVSN